MLSPRALLAVVDVPEDDGSDGDGDVCRMPPESGVEFSGSPWEALASKAPKCPWSALAQKPPECEARTQLALVEVARADDGESGTPPDVAPTGSERRFTTGGGSFRSGAPTTSDLMLSKSAIIACLKRLWMPYVPDQVAPLMLAWWLMLRWTTTP